MARTFGGDWTEKKLEALAKYLEAYLTIMHRNRAAQMFSITYLDGFAGSGRRYVNRIPTDNLTLDDLEEIRPDAEGLTSEELVRYYEGSAIRALRAGKHGGFHKYIFIETAPDAIQELEQLRSNFPDKDIEIVNRDANDYICQWCGEMTPYSRAVVFLDPFGLQVKWTTIEAIAQTRKIDMWLLIPLGQAIMRMLPKGHKPSEAFTARLTEVLGTEEWLQRFYTQTGQGALFEDASEDVQRIANVEQVAKFIVERLLTIFPEDGVLKKPLILHNSKRNPIYMLCFAASNPRGAKTAVKIAGDIVGRD